MRTVRTMHAPFVYFNGLRVCRFFARLPVLTVFAQDARDARTSESVLHRRRHFALDGCAFSYMRALVGAASKPSALRAGAASVSVSTHCHFGRM